MQRFIQLSKTILYTKTQTLQRVILILYLTRLIFFS